MPVGRQLLKPLKNDRGTDYDANHHPNSTWVSQTEQDAKDQIGSNPLIDWIVSDDRPKSIRRQSYKDNEPQRDPKPITQDIF